MLLNNNIMITYDDLRRRAHAFELMGRDKMREAIACWSELVHVAPHDAVMWSHWGLCLMAIGARDAALEKFNIAISIDPGIKCAWMGRGNCTMALGISDASALHDFTHVLDMFAAEEGINNDTGGIDTSNSVMTMNIKLAVNTSSRMLKEQVLYARGCCLFNMGRFREAVEDLDRVIANNAVMYSAALLRGMCHAHLGAHDAAIIDYTRAILLLSARSADVHRLVGIWKLRSDSHKATNNWNAAMSDLSTAICLLGPTSDAESAALIQEFSRVLLAAASQKSSA